jgi:folate-binding protein YgfZ
MNFHSIGFINGIMHFDSALNRVKIFSLKPNKFVCKTMNQKWQSFIASNTPEPLPGNNKNAEKDSHDITSIPQLGILTITGRDACQFLQGQTTCDFKNMDESKCSLGALCTPKGRTISTFIAFKKKSDYLLILPSELCDTVRKKLQMYILRSEVKILDHREEYCLIGVINTKTSIDHPKEIYQINQHPISIIKYPSSIDRFLIIARTDEAIKLWSNYVQEHHYLPVSPARWTHLDIIDGIPWLDCNTSEEFIPQMLNLDKLGGISFNKGCYTGQEIVARTHYLGKSKRQMYLAECQTHELPQSNSAILNSDAGTEKNIGRVLVAQQHAGVCQMLVVMQSSEEQAENIRLDYPINTKINVSHLPQFTQQ